MSDVVADMIPPHAEGNEGEPKFAFEDGCDKCLGIKCAFVDRSERDDLRQKWSRCYPPSIIALSSLSCLPSENRMAMRSRGETSRHHSPVT